MHIDVPSPIDLRQLPDAIEWEQTAMEKRPWRAEFFKRFASEMAAISPQVKTVLELGSGPGFLAEHLLSAFTDIRYVLLDFSPAMHQLARARLGVLAERAAFIERSFKTPDWSLNLGTYDCIVTNQAVHELRHKCHAVALHEQARALLSPGGSYLACDHFVGDGGMTNCDLYMTIEEQRQALLGAGFSSVQQLFVKGGMVLHKAS